MTDEQEAAFQALQRTQAEREMRCRVDELELAHRTVQEQIGLAIEGGVEPDRLERKLGYVLRDLEAAQSRLADFETAERTTDEPE